MSLALTALVQPVRLGHSVCIEFMVLIVGCVGCAFIMHRDSALTCQQAITHCKSRRAIVDPAIWPFLMGLLEALESSYCGSGKELDNNSTLDLNVEGWKVLADQLVPTCDNQETPDNHTKHFQAGDLQLCANKLSLR